MSFSELQFITDENIDVEVKDLLRQNGFNVFDIKDERLFSMPDRAILELSYREKRVVITQDSDFGTLIFRDHVFFCGVIYLRPGHVSPHVHVETVQSILAENLKVKFPFIIVAENNENDIKIRFRQF
jgi:predicted nuclease of predicted toxin-antitoxin system